MKKLLIPVLGVALLATSCKKENVEPTTPSNLKIPYTSLSASSNYKTTFVDAAGKTTVDFSGQTTRINMLKEMDAHMKAGTSADIDATKLINMFRNQNTPFTSADLNAATDKVISSKTAQSFSATEADAERQRFIGYFNELERISKMNGQTAAQGKAGVLGTNRLVDEKGFEYSQFVQKGLIGAMMLDQIANIYLGTDKQSADNTTPNEGKNYTAMEHHWDEAYGYLTSNDTYPIKGSESFLGEYARQGASVGGGADNLYLAFLKGRAAIVNNDLTTRDEQIAYIRTELEKAVAAVAISYLNKTNSATDDASRFHALSEGVGFIYSLRFAHNAKINRAKSEELLNLLMGKANGFWDLKVEDINNVRDQVATTFGIDKTTVLSH
jgi:hypothetical protein